MVDVTIIGQLLETLRDYQGRLRSRPPQSLDAFLVDVDSIDLARERLRVSIEACIDIARHIVASEGISASSAQEAMEKLNTLGVVPDDFLPTLIRMVGMRNALVHTYRYIDNRQVYAVIQNDLGDFDRFVQHILAYMDRQEQLKD
ncbi:MAG: hypothetical protein Kow00120_23280 [Anaerolineae bacterium]